MSKELYCTGTAYKAVEIGDTFSYKGSNTQLVVDIAETKTGRIKISLKGADGRIDTWKAKAPESIING